MLNHLLSDLRELLELVRKIENFDVTLAAYNAAGKPFEPTQAAREERRWMEQRMIHLRDKWAI